MRKETIEKALEQLPCTRMELATKLGKRQQWACQVAAYLITNRYAEEWGTQLTDKGVLVPILKATGKIPC